MAAHPQLEAYLTALDRALGPVPASSRAEIILEIKSHVLDAQDKEPTRKMDALLASLGTPEAVANRYLMERGLKPQRRPRSPAMKWLAFGMIGSTAVAVGGLAWLLVSFSPLVNVDGDKGSVEILGGLISVHDGDSAVADIAVPVDRQKVDRLAVSFGTGRAVMRPSSDDQIHYRCRGIASKAVEPKLDARTLQLDLATFRVGNCELRVPANLDTAVSSANGRLQVIRPQGNLDINVANGRVALEPDDARAYKYDLHVTNGRVDNFTSSTAPDALNIKIVLANGKIVNERGTTH